MACHQKLPCAALLRPPLSWLSKQRESRPWRLVLAVLLTACGAPQEPAVSPVNAAEEVGREVHDADPHTPAPKQAPSRSKDAQPADESGD